MKYERVYISASFPRKDEARALAEELLRQGVIITSRWLWQAECGYDTEAIKSFADDDLRAVKASNALIVLTGDTLSKGGRHCEVGIALGLGIPVYRIGPAENGFLELCLDYNEHLADWE